MKKIFRFLLILVTGIIIGYVFHNHIDSKLKAKFGEETVEASKTIIENNGKKIVENSEKIVDVGKAGVNAARKELDNN